MSVSTEWQSASAKHTHTHTHTLPLRTPPPTPLDHRRTPSSAPCSTQQAPPSRVSVLYMVVHICQSQSPNSSHPLSPTLCLLVRSLRLHFYSHFANRFICTILSRFHIYTLIYDSCFSLSDFLHPAWQTLGSPTSLQMTQLCSFCWLNNIKNLPVMQETLEFDPWVG